MAPLRTQEGPPGWEGLTCNVGGGSSRPSSGHLVSGPVKLLVSSLFIGLSKAYAYSRFESPRRAGSRLELPAWLVLGREPLGRWTEEIPVL